ncbi:MAG: hypothetical protein ACREF4_22990, partial [Gammaproteobacteria bacterium]
MGSNRGPEARGTERSPQELLDGIRARGRRLRRRRTLRRMVLAVTLPVTGVAAAFVALPQLRSPAATTIEVAGGSGGEPGTGTGGAPPVPEPGPEAPGTPSPSTALP